MKNESIMILITENAACVEARVTARVAARVDT